MPSPTIVRGSGDRPWRDEFRARVLMPSTPRQPLPRWARAGDALTVVLAVVACVIAVSGGFREDYGDVHLIVTSWVRLAMLSAVVCLVRHAVRPAPPITGRLYATAVRAWASPAVRTALAAAVATRLAVVLVGYFASVIITPVPGSVLFRDNTSTLANLSARWDAGWYLGIVRDGYKWDGNRRIQQNVVFFPALPALMYVFGLLLGRQWLVAGVLVSTCAFAWATTYLFRLAREQLSDDAATSAVWLLATYPFAVYFSAPYTEGLYLLGTVGAVYHMVRREHAAAAGWGLLAGFCRPNGFLLAGPLAILAAGPFVRAWWRRRAGKPTVWPRIDGLQFVAILAPVIAVGFFSAYLWFRFDDPLAWQQGQLAWGRRYVGTWRGFEVLFTDRWKFISRMGFMAYPRLQPFDMLNACAALLAAITLVPLTLRLGLAYGALVALNLFPPLLAGGTMSIGRMTSVMFPMFLWLGARVPPSRLPAWTAVFAVLQGLVAVLFYTWRPAF